MDNLSSVRNLVQASGRFKCQNKLINGELFEGYESCLTSAYFQETDKKTPLYRMYYKYG